MIRVLQLQEQELEKCVQAYRSRDIVKSLDGRDRSIIFAPFDPLLICGVC